MTSIPEIATQLVDNAPLSDTNCTTIIVMGSKSSKVVRNYKRKGMRSKVDEGSLFAAIEDVIKKRFSIRKSAAVHNVKASTLQTRITNMKKREESGCPVSERKMVSKYTTKSHQGKSSLLQSFLEKTENPKETLVLEYSFARKSNQKQGVIEKSICHVWEYGGNLNMIKSVLASIPMKGRLTFCIIADLSKIKTIWGTLEVCFAAIESRSGENFEVILFGGKYDVFKNYDNDTKKLINTTLRSIALLKNCHLFYYSSKEQPLLRRAKEILNGVAFGTGFPMKDKVSGLSKPLFIPKGSDSWGSIGVNESSISQVKSRHLAVVPLELESAITNPTFSTSAPSTHFEHQLDTIFSANYDQIRNIASYDVNLAECL